MLQSNIHRSVLPFFMFRFYICITATSIYVQYMLRICQDGFIMRNVMYSKKCSIIHTVILMAEVSGEPVLMLPQG